MPTRFAASRNIDGVEHVVCHTCGTQEAVDTSGLVYANEVDTLLDKAAHDHNVKAGHTDDNGDVI